MLLIRRTSCSTDGIEVRREKDTGQIGLRSFDRDKDIETIEGVREIIGLEQLTEVRTLHDKQHHCGSNICNVHHRAIQSGLTSMTKY